MKKTIWTLIFLSLIFCNSCQKQTEKDETQTAQKIEPLSLTDEELYDKVLGMLVGSAIGDAMGAPTEMWSREMILREYGFVTDLDPMIREVSPEGIWIPNLPAGGTTDDTRWKKLTFDYLSKENTYSLDPKSFAGHILDQFDSYMLNFKKIEVDSIQELDENNLKVFWLKEWVKVARPYLKDDLEGIQKGLGTFYGGEMVCAGLLYAPAIGAFFPENPEKAYQEAFKLSFFDIGYAKDISALSAALTSAAMTKGIQGSDLLEIAKTVDPENFYSSRLVGRSSYRILQTALQIVYESNEINHPGVAYDSIIKPINPDLNYIQPAYERLDKHLQDMPFHAGEIYLQVLTAMIFSDFDFKNTLVFLVNYGRDNDTTAAIAGSILGALVGFENLPVGMKEKVLDINKNMLEIDLEKSAFELTENILRRYP
ncbi:ADP-ribosylglycohydrolase [Aquiflexum balticum DSM 16537]|uniref:ADP-ribosylglycohydrolase n=1 Tax=Aquiflexum balticum DSM 16537 TaxID=758820 RepID=A0A1W2H7G4_9BACT|nr:ADP-ribosylglycohydrolase family protein [Aquiflexum balticum]SMD44588.1 ADP-ribosylglycohydrolase [Aquiflexum balticum DSM 16537]